MKIVFVLLSLLSIVPAHASYYRYVCSSPDAEVRWEDSHNDNTIYFTYYDWDADEEKKFQLDVDSVKFKFLSKKTIKKIHSNDRCSSSSDHYFHGRVRITPTSEVAAQFKKAFKKGYLTDYVICHDHNSSESGEDCK